MRGMLIGGLIGAAIAIGMVFALNTFGVWVALGEVGSLIGGFLLGTVFTNLGIYFGGVLDDGF